MKPQTLHCHTTFCDGADSPAAMAAAAFAAGCGAIGFSGHSPLPGQEAWAMDPARVADYRRAVMELKAEYAGRMEVYLGLEQDFYSPDTGPDWDYKIGSVHCLPLPDGTLLGLDESAATLAAGVARWFAGDWMALARAYYARMARVDTVTGGEIVGHFDLITKFNEGGAQFDEGDPVYREAALAALHALAARGRIFEINTGAVSRGYRTAPYPAAFLLRELAAVGGRITFSSDSHSAATVLYGYREAIELARACGFSRCWYRTGRGFVEGPLPVV